MLALCLMLSGDYYAKNYAGIIGLGLSEIAMWSLYSAAAGCSTQLFLNWPGQNKMCSILSLFYANFTVHFGNSYFVYTCSGFYRDLQ